jgi:uncharacterized protein YecE (DUF72 family)
MAHRRIGTVDLPVRVPPERYFRELSYLELSAWFAGPLKPSSAAKWQAVAPAGSLGLVAPWVLTHRKPPLPKAPRLWPHDASVGDFRDSEPGRAALAELTRAVSQLAASHVVFRSPPLFAASAANRDLLRQFFGEIATSEVVGAERVWVPDGLWDLRTAVRFASEIDVTCAIDPLIRDPGEPPELFYELELESLYLRISGLGRSGPIRAERLDELLALLEHYEELPATITFDSPERWQDARNFKKLLSSS